MQIAIAIVPSNQESNVSSINPAYNEMGGMYYLARQINSYVNYDADNLPIDIKVKIIPIKSEKEDTYPLQGLIEAIEAANQWLYGQSGFKLILSLHTDSGNFSHTFGIVGDTKYGHIATQLVAACQRILLTQQSEVFRYRNDIDYGTYIFHTKARYPSVLLEICAHDNEWDMNNLWRNSDKLGAELACALFMLDEPIYPVVKLLHNAKKTIDNIFIEWE